MTQLPVRVTAISFQSGLGWKVPRRDGVGSAADTATRRSVVRPWGSSPRGRLSRHQRSQSASRLPVDIGRRSPLDGRPDKAVQLPR